MRHFILITILILLSNTIWAQLDYEEGASPGVINWSDPVYNDFFNGSCAMNSKIEKSATLLRLLTRFYQNGQTWSSKQYGVISDSCGTIGEQGCYLTCLSMMLSSSGDYIDPGNLTEFVFGDPTRHLKCGLIADNVLKDRPSNVLVGDNRDNIQSVTDAIKNRIKSKLNNNGFVIAHVKGCGHFILIYDWANVGGNDIFYTADPDMYSTKTNLSEYDNICDVRYYIPTENAIASEIVVNGINPESKIVRVSSGLPLWMSIELPQLKKATIKESATDCIKKLWVVKNESGTVIDQVADADNYTFSQNAYGIYYVSCAVSDGNDFEGKTIEVIVSDGSSDQPIVVNRSDCPDNLPTCGDGKCDANEWNCEQCKGDCSDQYVDQGFRINNSFDDVVYLCSKNFTITPIKGSFICGTETEHHFCWLSIFIWEKCPFFYSNMYVDIIECNSDKTEKAIVHNFSYRTDNPQTTNDIYHNPYNSQTYFKKLDSGDMSSILSEGKYYKIVLKTFFDSENNYHPAGWISSYKYIYITPSHTYNSSSPDVSYIQSYVVIQNKNLSGNVVVKAKNSIYLEPDTHILSNFNASIDPGLSVVDCDPIVIPPGPIICQTAKAAEPDTSHISNNPDQTNNLVLDAKLMDATEESNISIYPNPNNGSFTILLKNEIVNDLSVINMFGQEVCYNSDRTSDSSVSISLTDSSNGIYVVRLRGKQKTYERKIIVGTK